MYSKQSASLKSGSRPIQWDSPGLPIPSACQTSPRPSPQIIRAVVRETQLVQEASASRSLSHIIPDPCFLVTNVPAPQTSPSPSYLTRNSRVIPTTQRSPRMSCIARGKSAILYSDDPADSDHLASSAEPNIDSELSDSSLQIKSFSPIANLENIRGRSCLHHPYPIPTL